MAFTWFNGSIIDEDDARVSVRDFGLLHAAGAFTTLRAGDGRVPHLDRHLARLRDSCETFHVPLPYADDELTSAVAELLGANDLAEARMRLTVTRGEPVIDPVRGPSVRPSVFLTATKLEPYPAELYERGMTVLAYDEFKLNPYDPQAGHKTLDYLSRLNALREAQRRGANEALLFNVHNFLQSATVANVFVVKNGILLTPPTSADLRDADVTERTPYPRSNVLPGVTRGSVLERATAMSIPVERRALTIHDVLAADELFLTNSILRVMPVCRVERKPVGDETVGSITRKLMDAIAAEAES